MQQLRNIGGGVAEDTRYETWEVKKCPSCGRLVKEFYSAEVINQNQAHSLEKAMDPEIIREDIE